MRRLLSRFPLCRKGNRLYHRRMSSPQAQRIADGPAVPLSMTVNRDAGRWHVQVWYHGSTVLEALHPVLVADRWLDPGRVPPQATWHTLWFHVADALVDLADGEVTASYEA